MTDNKPSVQQKERRLRNRWLIPKSLDAKVTIWTQQRAGDGRNETPEQYWQGCLGNICEAGAQIIVDADCWERLRTNQRVKLQLDISSSETEIQTEVTGQVRYMVPDEQDNRIKLGIEFSESALNADTKRAIHQVCEDVEPCPECTFDECPNL
ncbi:MAG: hypothetical protein FVQ85_03180 [Planctomycetes bacterium]|nr:hypothetical protein [Planctomycetota bacterium]